MIWADNIIFHHRWKMFRPPHHHPGCTPAAMHWTIPSAWTARRHPLPRPQSICNPAHPRCGSMAGRAQGAACFPLHRQQRQRGMSLSLASSLTPCSCKSVLHQSHLRTALRRQLPLGFSALPHRWTALPILRGPRRQREQTMQPPL